MSALTRASRCLASRSALRFTPRPMRHPIRPSANLLLTRTLAPLALPALIAASAILAGCGDDGGAPPPPPGGTIFVEPANNYSSDSELHIPTIRTEAEADLHICWDTIVRDIQCHSLDPVNDIDMITLVSAKSADQDEVAGWLDAGTFGEDQANSPTHEYDPEDGTDCVDLSEFVQVGNRDTNIDLAEAYKERDDATYLMLWSTGTKIGLGARMMAF